MFESDLLKINEDIYSSWKSWNFTDVYMVWALPSCPLTYERQLRSLKTYYIQTWQSY